jgi:hypothetical protein
VTSRANWRTTGERGAARAHYRHVLGAARNADGRGQRDLALLTSLASRPKRPSRRVLLYGLASSWAGSWEAPWRSARHPGPVHSARPATSFSTPRLSLPFEGLLLVGY